MLIQIKWNNKVFIVFQNLTFSLNKCKWNIMEADLMNLIILIKIITMTQQVKVEDMYNLNSETWTNQIQIIHP